MSSNPIQYVTLVSGGGTPVRIADQKGSPYPTTGYGALVFNINPTIEGGLTVNGDLTYSGNLIGPYNSPLTTQGDLYYYGPTGNTRLPLGAAGTTLTSDGNNAIWRVGGASPGGAAGGDLDGTYPNPTIKLDVGLQGDPTRVVVVPVGTNNQTLATTKFVKDQNYLTAASAGTTYLPLAGGTLTGGLTGTTATFSTFVTAGVTASTGTALLNSGGAGNAGYLAIFNPAGTRLGYIGFNNGVMSYNADSGFHHEFTSGAVSILGNLTGTTATFSGNVNPAVDAGSSLGSASFRWNTLNAATGNFTSALRTQPTIGIPAGGTAGSGVNFSITANFGVNFGSGAPTVSMARGSIYLRSDGSPYVNLNGTTTWGQLALTTDVPTTLPPSGVAGGDLSGTYPNPLLKPSVNNTWVMTTVAGVAAWAAPAGGGGGGSVTAVSVVSANGLAGTVANASTTPAITLSTTVTGLLKGNGTAISAATAGTDYVTPGGLTTALGSYLPLAGGTLTGPLIGTTAKFATSDTALAVLFSGTTKGVRFGFNSTGTSIEGVDNTGTGSFQPLFLNGTSVNVPTPAPSSNDTSVASTAWVRANGGGGGASVTVSDTAPGSPTSGALWWNSTLGVMFIWYVDPDTSQWVPVVPSGGTTPPNSIPQNSQTGSYTLVANDAGAHLYHPVAAAAATWTIPANASVPYAIGTTLSFVNDSVNNVTVAITTDTLVLSPGTTTGSRTLATGGVATAIKVTSTRWIINGTGLT